MGEYADMELDRLERLSEEFYGQIPMPVYPNPVFNIWTTLGGDILEITDMSNEHLNNCIRMLKRGNAPLKDGYIKSMTHELERRKKMNLGKYNISGMTPPVNELHEQMQNTQNIQSEQPQVQQPIITNVDLKVVGVTFANEDGSSRKAIIMEMVGNEQIDLIREPSNKFDPNAIKVLADDRQIGYIGKEYASIMAPMMDNGTQFVAIIKGCGEYNKRPYCEITINQL